MKDKKYRVEIIINRIDKKTDTYIWEGTTIVEHKTIDGFLGDPKENKERVLKSYIANKGSDYDG